MPLGSWFGISSFLMSPSRRAGLSYPVAQDFDEFSSRMSYCPALKASRPLVPSRQFAVISRFQREADAALAGFLEFRHIAVIGAVARVPLLAQRVEGPDDVLGGHRRAVVKARALAQGVDNRQLVGGEVDRLGREP